MRNQPNTLPAQSQSLDPLWDQVVSFVSRNYSTPSLSLQTISAALHIPERTLGKLFQMQAGQTFKEYLRGIRIQEAAHLLVTSAEGVKTISTMTGYTDPSHFARYFHEATGCTPAEYRNQRSKLAQSAVNSASR